MTTPNRPPDQVLNNVGKRFGPPQSTELAPDNNFAGTTYVTGCSGSTATNPDRPPFRYELDDGTTLNSNNLTITESDGTVKQYFVNGNEVATDFYIKNDGLTEGQYNALSQSQKNLYCDRPVGGTGGAVTGVRIADAGNRLYAANNPNVNTGSGGAQITVTVNSAGQITGTNIVSGGSGYQVGDTFTVDEGKNSFAYPETGTLEVTSVSGGSGGKYYLSNPSSSGTRVREVSRNLSVRIWNPLDDGPIDSPCSPAGRVVSQISVIARAGVPVSQGPPYVVGSGPYADVSDWTQAVVHAGLAEPGDFVNIELVSSGPNKLASFTSSTRNGVTSISSNDEYCAYDIRLYTPTSNDGPECTPENSQETREFIVGQGGVTLGIPTAVELVNPNAKPGIPGIGSGSNSATDWNWYSSCPPQVNGRPGTWPRQYGCGIADFFVDGPSKNSNAPKGQLAFRYTIQVYDRAPGVLPGTGCVIPANDDSSFAGKESRWRLTTITPGTTLPAWRPEPGWAVGDILEIRSLGCTNDSFCNPRPDEAGYPNGICPGYTIDPDVTAKVRITAIDTTGGTTQTESKIEYNVYKDVLLRYPEGSGLTSINNTMVTGYTDSTDNVLTESARIVTNKFITGIRRDPRELEFQYYVRQVYDAGGVWTTTIQNLFNNEFADEIAYKSVSNSGPEYIACNGGDDDDDGGNNNSGPIGGDSQCKYSRDEFYRGTGGTSNGQVDLYELWNFLGSPRNNPNPICPRPDQDSGLPQDNEPDMTDFAGMKLQKWKPCTDGSNNGNDILGSYEEIIVPCEGDLPLSFFLDTRIAPWWGDQELAPPTLSVTKGSENIYMVNVPPTQTEEYFFKASPTLNASGKTFFEVVSNINYPGITGTRPPGEPAIQMRNTVRVSWYARTTANPGLQILGGFDTAAGGSITNNYGVQITASGNPYGNGTSGNLITTLTVNEARDGKCSRDEADNLDFSQAGTEFFCKIEVDNRPFNPKSPGTGTFMPGFGGQASNNSSYLNSPSRFFLNNIECNDASISCGGNSQIDVPTGTNTTISFRMTINTNCLQYRSGTARISIKREWPCPIFGPANPAANQWVVQKQTVAIPQTNSSSAVIQYNLTVPTDKRDYLAGEDGVNVAPGDCHWNYVAYWEIDYPGVDCRANAWENPGCNYGSGRNQLDQIYCIQDQQCTGESVGPSGPGPTGSGCTANEANCCDNALNDPSCYVSFGCIDYRNFVGCPDPSGPLSGNNDPAPGTSPFGAGCECPVCQQSIFVRVLEGTDCGILGQPNQQEGGGDGPNNARIEFFSEKDGFTAISDRTSNPFVLNKDVLRDCDPELVPGSTPSDKCLEFFFDDWVYLTRKTFDTFITLGNDAAIDVITDGSGTNDAALYAECCDGSGGCTNCNSSFDCQDFFARGGCATSGAPDAGQNPDVDCDETVFTQASWYVKYNYKNGTNSGLQPLPIFLGGPEYDSYLERYNPGAGTNTEALRYKGEVGITSKKASIGFVDMQYDIQTVKSVEVFLNITSTNDKFGAPEYHPPPPGFRETDFGTTDFIVSLRGSQGAGPNNPARKNTFQVAHFSVAEKLDVPEFTGSSDIECPEGDVVFEGNRVTPDVFEFCCGGEIGGCQNTAVSFTCQSACEGGGCDKQPLPGPSQEVSLCAINSDNNQFSIDWKDIPPSERKEVKILWYINGRLRYTRSLSAGERCSPNFRRWLDKPEKNYNITYYIVASSDGLVAHTPVEYFYTRENKPEGACSYFDVGCWTLDTRYAGTSGKIPIEQSNDIKDGERWQTIMGAATCILRTGPDVDTVSIQNPEGSISISVDGPGPGTGPCNSGNCCNPSTNEYYTSTCNEVREALQANNIECCTNFGPTGPVPGPGGPGVIPR